MATDPRLAGVPATANELLADRAIRHAVFLERYKRGQVKEVLNFLDRSVFPDLLQKVRATLPDVTAGGVNMTPGRSKRLQEMLVSMDKTIRTGVRSSEAKFRKELRDLALSEAEWQRSLLNQAVPRPLDISFVIPNPQQLSAIVTSRPFQGRLLGEWFEGLGVDTSKRVKEQVQIGLAQGESIDVMVRRLRGTKVRNFTDGVLQITRRNAEATVRTATTHVSVSAREDTYRENQDVVKGVQYVATLDARTTDICISLDGKVFPVNEGPRPPMHHQCRSTTVPVLKSLEELGLKSKNFPPETRASMKGQTAGNQNYTQWLKKQSKEFQDDVLGKGRAAKFRKGTLTPNRFVDDAGKTYTLEDLRRLEGQSPKPKPKPKPIDEGPAPTPPPASGKELLERELAEKGPAKSGAEAADRLARATKLVEDRKAQITAKQTELQKELVRLHNSLDDDPDWQRTLKNFREENPNLNKNSRIALEDNLEQEFLGPKLKPINKQIKNLREENKKLNENLKLTFNRNLRDQDTPGALEAANAIPDRIANKRASTAVEWINSVSNGKKIKGDVEFRFDLEEKRAYYDKPNGGVVTTGRRDDVETYIHEIGHHIENITPGLTRRMKDFLERRTKGEKFRKMSEVTGNIMYEDIEITKPDKFFNPYVGKQYPDDTEVLSMGIERLFKDPLEFLKDDREHFELIIDVLKGL